MQQTYILDHVVCKTRKALILLTQLVSVTLAQLASILGYFAYSKKAKTQTKCLHMYGNGEQITHNLRRQATKVMQTQGKLAHFFPAMQGMSQNTKILNPLITRIMKSSSESKHNLNKITYIRVCNVFVNERQKTSRIR